ncbi:glycosyltransferase [Variovorax sp. UC122_21]|uniref:glycosyltransferase n=1 Tax=Variovorax sp. UC122_21 TaxID=3374554 RepID=UPI0037581AD3
MSNNVINVTHIVGGLDVGGAERALYRLIISHKNKSAVFSHRVISLTTKGPLGLLLEENGIQVTALGMKGARGGLKTFWRLSNILRKESPDVVQCWMYYSDLLGGIAARTSCNAKVIWGIRNSKFEAGGTLFKRAVRKICAFLSPFVPDKIVCVAESARELHIGVGYHSAKMVVIPNGFEIDEFVHSAFDRQRFAPNGVSVKKEF